MNDWKRIMLRHCSVEPRGHLFFTHKSVTPLSIPSVTRYLRELVRDGLLSQEGDRYETTFEGLQALGPTIAPSKTYTNATMQTSYVPKDMTAYRPGALDFMRYKSKGTLC